MNFESMQKFLTAAVVVAISTTSLGQKEVVSAYNANKEGDYATAATYIEQAVENPKANIKNKTWRYRGDIYLNISRDSALFAAYPDALVKAKESFMKAIELDPKGSYAQETTIGLGQVQMQASNAGIGSYNAGAYGPAGQLFDLAAEIASAFETVDTMAVYNSALCYEKAGNLEMAVTRYQDCAAIGYQVPNVYLFISNLYRNAERVDEALATLQAARELYPREQSLIIEELNIYLTNQEFDKAKENLAIAAEQDPTNEILWFSLGSVLDNLGNSDEAIGAYIKALEIAPDYFDANYNLGALYFNQAVQGNQHQAGAARQLHRQAGQEHKGGHDRKAATNAGNARQQAHQHPLEHQGRCSHRGSGNRRLVIRSIRSLLAAQHQPGRQQGCDGKHSQLHRLGDPAGLHHRASDPSPHQSRHPQEQGRTGCDEATAQIGNHVGDRQQGHHHQRQGHRIAGGEAGSRHEDGKQQDRSTGTKHRQ